MSGRWRAVEWGWGQAGSGRSKKGEGSASAMQAPGEQEGPPRRKRRRRWDQGPAAPDPGDDAQQPPPQPLAAAQHAVAHHLAAQQAVAHHLAAQHAVAHLQTAPHPAAQQGVVGGAAAAAPAPAAPVSAPLEATVDLCACGADARRALCSRKAQADITSSTGCSLTTRGRYRKKRHIPSIVSHLPSSPTRKHRSAGRGRRRRRRPPPAHPGPDAGRGGWRCCTD